MPIWDNQLRFLNEVLSLNAQESCGRAHDGSHAYVLNEVLSLNAQEFFRVRVRHARLLLLNEVLSLNAQELPCFFVNVVRVERSSMKS